MLARFLWGTVLEIGPGYQPFPTADGSTVIVADRPLTVPRDELFPELADAPPFIAPDVELDLDTDRLKAFDDASFDGVVASHVLEHLAEPIGALVEIGRVLRVGGFAVLLLPERTRTFDAGRIPTSLAHLADEHRNAVSEISREHLAEYLGHVEGREREVRDDELELHRRRSIHVHCWAAAEFLPVIAAAEMHSEHSWELVEILLPEDVVDGIEFALVLQKVPRTPTPFLQKLGDMWCQLVVLYPHRNADHLASLSAVLVRDQAELAVDGDQESVMTLADQVAQLYRASANRTPTDTAPSTRNRKTVLARVANRIVRSLRGMRISRE